MENEVPEYQLVWDGKASHVYCLFAKIYTLSDLNGIVFYVGATTDTLQQRLYAHLCHARTGRGNEKKNRMIAACNFSPTIDMVDIMYVTGYTRSMALNKARFLEHKWITIFRDQGVDLANSQYVPRPLGSEQKEILSDLQFYIQKQKANTHE